ncbi:alpha/beta hydrolase [Streptomyces sp. RS2]|uniref:alpha/beta fold hydrolase n=1 Tax=Streptomyces sp. RS2 TaxID=1451205 RepID=UPI0027E2D027|nr:alpha/beta hydrolase [Streptomyces sp. RS2]
MWDPQVLKLYAAGYRVVRCDFRGFGESPVAGRPYSDATDVCVLIDALGLERVALIGSSHGGAVSLEVAAQRPKMISALMLLCSAIPGREPSLELQAFTQQKTALLAANYISGAVELSVTTWLGPEADPETRKKVRRMQRHAFEVQATAEFTSASAPVDLAQVTASCLAVSGGARSCRFPRGCSGYSGEDHWCLPL